MKENINFHTRTISLAEIMGEQWLVVLYYPSLTSPACAHWNLLYQRPEFICQTCFQRFPVENVTLTMELEVFLDRISNYIFTEYRQAKIELDNLRRKIIENHWKGMNKETDE